nr:MAG TPA: hypothetical protein [Caudoviricetes sp.]
MTSSNSSICCLMSSLMVLMMDHLSSGSGSSSRRRLAAERVGACVPSEAVRIAYDSAHLLCDEHHLVLVLKLGDALLELLLLHLSETLVDGVVDATEALLHRILVLSDASLRLAAAVGNLTGDVEVALHDSFLQVVVLTELCIPEIADTITDDCGLVVVLIGKTSNKVLEVIEVHSTAQASFGDCVLLCSATVPKSTAESKQKNQDSDTTISPIVFVFGYGSDVRQAHVIHDSLLITCLVVISLPAG